MDTAPARKMTTDSTAAKMGRIDEEARETHGSSWRD
jgi:hypothetical protein